jgi:predicted metal-binding protein
VKEMKLQDGLLTLRNYALELGATKATTLAVNDIVFDERARLKCIVPRCIEYGFNLMCPPNLPPISKIRQAIEKYHFGTIIQKEAALPSEMIATAEKGKNLSNLGKDKDFMDKYNQFIRDSWTEFHEMVCKVEAKAFSLGYRYAAGLTGGSCKLCDRCVGQKSGEQCRHPFKARPSMEAMGIDVLETAKRAKVPFEMPLRDRVVWTGLVLVD